MGPYLRIDRVIGIQRLIWVVHIYIYVIWEYIGLFRVIEDVQVLSGDIGLYRATSVM